jgi:hypothetical protein
LKREIKARRVLWKRCKRKEGDDVSLCNQEKAEIKTDGNRKSKSTQTKYLG